MKFNLIPELNRALIGFEQIFNQAHQTYPPYNVIKNPTGYQIEVAVSGFDKGDLKVTLQDHQLTITGVKPKTEDIYLVKTLAYRNFTKTFQVSEELEVDKITHSNGVLTIVLTTKTTKTVPLELEIN